MEQEEEKARSVGGKSKNNPAVVIGMGVGCRTLEYVLSVPRISCDPVQVCKAGCVKTLFNAEGLN